MAKQSGIHQLKGKLRGMSYYRQKGVEDGLARSINQGLSKRVKEDAAYANTRLNAAEFGTAGSFAGAAIRAISDRQRAMLKDFATGALAKVVKDQILNDANSSWGSRIVVTEESFNLIAEAINTYAKNDFGYNVGGVWDVKVTTGAENNTWTPNAQLPSGWGSPLAAKGATGAFVDMYAYDVHSVQVGKAPYRAESAVHLFASEDITIGESGALTTAAQVPTKFDVEEMANELVRTLVVVRPYKEINGQKYIMQELCTFQLVTPTIA